ncbi:MAG: hypothetical protein KHX03_10110 [Clostridium sp.]|nr:hypothetical protein [Clostridium sp.]
MKLNLNTAVKFVTDPKTAGVAAFLGIGAYKTIKDYRKAEPHEKKKVLAYDAAVIGGTTIAYMAMRPLSNWICKTKVVDTGAKLLSQMFHCFKLAAFSKKSMKPSVKVQKTLEETKKALITSLKTAEDITKDCISGCLNTFAGFLGAIYSAAVMKKFVLSKPYFNPPKSKNSGNDNENETKTQGYFQNSVVFKNFNTNSDTLKTVKHLTTTVLGMPEMRVFDVPMMAISGFAVADTKGYHNKFKKTTYTLIAYTLIPTFFYSLVSSFVKNAKGVYKYPLLFASLVGGGYAGKAVGDSLKEKIDKKIDGIDMKYIAIK